MQVKITPTALHSRLPEDRSGQGDFILEFNQG